MFSAQMTGISFRAADFIDVENMEGQLIETLAKEVPQRQQSGGPLDQLSDEDITFLSKTLVGPRAPPISRLQRANSSIISAVFDVVNKVGLHLSLALRAPLDAGSQPNPKIPSFAEGTPPSARRRAFSHPFSRNGELVLKGIARGG